MLPIKQRILLNAFFVLSRLGAHRASLKCIDRMVVENISLNRLRQAVDIASRTNDEQSVMRYATVAIDRYPANSFGYLEKAKILTKKGDRDAAEKLMEQAPHSTQTSKILASLKHKPSKKTTHTNPLETELQNAGNDQYLLSTIASAAEHNIVTTPLDDSNYDILTKAYQKLGQYASIIALIDSMPQSISSRLNYRLLLATAHQKESNQILATNILLAAQIDYPSERKLLMRISDLLRDDAKVEKAYSYILAAYACYPEYGAVRKLSFEIDHKLYDEAQRTLEHVLTYPTEKLLKFLPIINRATPFFPQMRDQVHIARNRTRQLLDAKKGRKGMKPDDQLRVSIKCRWLEEAKRVIQRAKYGQQPVSTNHQVWLDTVIFNLGENRSLVEIASYNEQSSKLCGLRNGRVVTIDESKIDPSKVVEVFIPTVFFASPDEEKPSYKTVREFLSNIYNYLRGRNDLTIVPRHQWNWRHCDPLIQGARVVSYHTSSSYDPNHLHVQEVPLAGRCSMDNQGFAGYSSLSKNYEAIISSTNNCTIDELRTNTQKLAKQYIESNISKYQQETERVTFSGNYVFIALQIPTDIVASLASISGTELVTLLAQHYRSTGTKVIVKRHPYCNSKTVQEVLSRLENQGDIEISKASVHDLISGAKAVFTVNSGVGLEALLHGKPVVITGECDYAYAVSAQAKTPEELATILSGEIEFNITRSQKLLHHYVNCYSAQANDIQFINNSLSTWLDQKNN